MKKNLKSYLVLIIFGALLIGTIIGFIYLSIASTDIVSDYSNIKTSRDAHMKPIYKIEKGVTGDLVLQTTIEQDVYTNPNSSNLTGDKSETDLSGDVESVSTETEDDSE